MPVRIYDIAKKLGIESKEVLVKARELGISTARVPSSSLDKITAEYLEEQLGYKPAPAPLPVTETLKQATTQAPAVEPQATITTAPATTVVEIAPEHVPTPEAPAPVQTVVEPVATAPVATEIEPVATAATPEVTTTPDVIAGSHVQAPEEVTNEVQTPHDVAPVQEAVEASAPNPSPEPTVAVQEPVVKVAPEPQEPIIHVIKTSEAPEIKVIIQPPSPPAPPPVPKVGDKVGFIQLPPKPGPKVGDKVGSVQLPQRSGPRVEHPQRGGRDQRPPRPGQGPSRNPVKPPYPGRHPAQPPRPGGRPGAPESPKYVSPATGEMLTMKPPIVVRSLAEMLKRKPFQLIADLMELGVFANVNQTIEEPVAQRLCAKYGFRFEVEKRERGGGQVHGPVIKKEEDPEDKPESLKPRPPVVTIMGHVDHGKTTLLDVIRKSDVAAGEAGGITQHIGAYTISFPHPERPKDIQQITFLDTPGHAAFSAMRARGANVTDIVVLVVAANDGVMPQTVEAINHAKAAKVPIMVAVNKCDHPNANPMRVRQQMQEAGLVCEEWGGSIIFQDLSALTKTGVDKLLELILLQAEMMELKANPDRPAKGNVIESGLEPGGPTATVLVRKGTLKVGDLILCGPYYGKARALTNEEGKRLKSAGPSVAVKLLGLNGVPAAGLEFSAVENEKAARDTAEQRAEVARVMGAEDRPKVTLENLFDSLTSEAAKILKVVVKADMQGSAEAILEALKKIRNDKVSLEVVHSAVGIITESDVILASASKAIVLGFHTRVDNEATEAAKREGVQIKLYSIIYELIDQVKDAMAGLLDPISKEVVLGAADVKKLFALSKGGNVAGCMIASGRIVRGRCRVIRRKDVVFEGTIGAIRRFQDEVNEVRAGMECGIRIDGFGDFQVGDSIESYTIEKITQKL